MKKRLLACLLTLVMLLALLPATALAADPTTSGSCGENLTWSIDSATGTLTISGTGAMADYTKASDQPWYSYANAITAVTLENGVTAIGAHSLRQLTAINTPLALPRSLEKIGSCALYMAHFSAFTVDAENTAFTAENGVLYNKDMTTLIAYPCGSAQISYVAPTSVQKISAYAFSSVKSLKTADFSAATNLSQVGQQAFESASSVNALFKNDGEITVQYEALKGIQSVAMRCASLKLAPYAFKDTDYVDLSSVTDIDAAFSGWWSNNKTFTNNGFNANVIAGANQVYTANETLAEYLSKLPIRDRSTKAPEIVIVDGGQFVEKSFAQAKDTYTPQKMKFAFDRWEKVKEYTNTSYDKKPISFTASIYRAKWTARTLTGLRIEPKQAEYVVGTTLTPADFTVTAVYDGGEQEIVLTEGYTIAPTEALTTLGDVKVTATFGEKTAECTIKVISAPVIPVTPSAPAQLPFNPDAGKTKFTDVAGNAWYASAVNCVVDKGLMNGTGEDKFSPNADTTRGMIVTILARLDGKNTSGTPWYQAGQRWAMEYEISDGMNMTGAITREQLVTMLFRYAVKNGLEAVTLSENLTQFTDASDISAWAVSAMQWAVGQGLIQGSNGQLRPQANASRAEVATILMRFCELLNK